MCGSQLAVAYGFFCLVCLVGGNLPTLPIWRHTHRQIHDVFYSLAIDRKLVGRKGMIWVNRSFDNVHNKDEQTEGDGSTIEARSVLDSCCRWNRSQSKCFAYLVCNEWGRGRGCPPKLQTSAWLHKCQKIESSGRKRKRRSTAQSMCGSQLAVAHGFFS